VSDISSVSESANMSSNGPSGMSLRGSTNGNGSPWDEASSEGVLVLVLMPPTPPEEEEEQPPPCELRPE